MCYGIPISIFIGLTTYQIVLISDVQENAFFQPGANCQNLSAPLPHPISSISSLLLSGPRNSISQCLNCSFTFWGLRIQFALEMGLLEWSFRNRKQKRGKSFREMQVSSFLRSGCSWLKDVFVRKYMDKMENSYGVWMWIFTMLLSGRRSWFFFVRLVWDHRAQ